MTALVEAIGLALSGRLEPSDFLMKEPELVCLIGPNGSGKTSLLHALSGIGGPSGSLYIDGLAPRYLSPDQRMRLFAYLPATREVTWPISGLDLVTLGLSSGRTEDARAIIDTLGLADFANRRVDRLSTGERSRILIARRLPQGRGCYCWTSRSRTSTRCGNCA